MVTVSDTGTSVIVFEDTVYVIARGTGENYYVNSGEKISIAQGGEDIFLEKIPPEEYETLAAKFNEAMYRKSWINDKVELINDTRDIREKQMENLDRRKEEKKEELKTEDRSDNRYKALERKR